MKSEFQQKQLKLAMKENKFNRPKPNTNNFFLIVYTKTTPCFQIFAYLILAERAAHSRSTGQDFW